jgi:uncharacterized protein involved in exopolysaccharide biosynthesis
MEEKTLLDYWLILYNRKWVIFTVMISAMVTSGVVSKYIPDVYGAKTVFFVPKNPDIVSYLSPNINANMVAKSPLTPVTSDKPHAPYIGILKSYSLAEAVHKEFPHKSTKEFFRDVNFSVSKEFMIEVFVRDNDPVLAANAANSFVRNFNEMIIKYSDPIWENKERMIKEEINTTKEELEHARMALQEFQEENRIADLNAETLQHTAIKNELQSTLKRTEISERENTSRIAALKQQIENEAQSFNTAGILVNSPVLEKLKQELTIVEGKLAKLKARNQLSSKEYKILKLQFATLEQDITSEILRMLKLQIKGPGTFYGNIRAQLVDLFVEKQRIQASLKAYKLALSELINQIKRFPELKLKRDKLNAEIARKRKILETFEISYEETKLQIKRQPELVVVVDEARPPKKPSFPNLFLNVIVAGIAGVTIGVFYSFFINFIEETRKERIDKLVRTVEAYEKKD